MGGGWTRCPHGCRHCPLRRHRRRRCPRYRRWARRPRRWCWLGQTRCCLQGSPGQRCGRRVAVDVHDSVHCRAAREQTPAAACSPPCARPHPARNRSATARGCATAFCDEHCVAAAGSSGWVRRRAQRAAAASVTVTTPATRQGRGTHTQTQTRSLCGWAVSPTSQTREASVLWQ